MSSQRNESSDTDKYTLMNFNDINKSLIKTGSISLNERINTHKSRPDDMAMLFDKDSPIDLKDYCRVWEFESEPGKFERHSDLTCMSYNIQYMNYKDTFREDPDCPCVF